MYGSSNIYIFEIDKFCGYLFDKSLFIYLLKEFV